MPVLVSGGGQIKLLGVPALPHLSSESAGKLVSEATVPLLEKWGCKEAIIGMGFDTTSANTGHMTAACITLQKDLQHHLFWFACRHHVGEVVLTHIWDALKIEVSRSPEITIFERFKAAWQSLPVEDTTDLKFPQLPQCETIDVEAIRTSA